jgi:hypothetical protein
MFRHTVTTLSLPRYVALFLPYVTTFSLQTISTHIRLRVVKSVTGVAVVYFIVATLDLNFYQIHLHVTRGSDNKNVVLTRGGIVCYQSRLSDYQFRILIRSLTTLYCNGMNGNIISNAKVNATAILSGGSILIAVS